MLCPDIWNLPQLKYNYEVIWDQNDLLRRKVSSGNFSEFITVVVPGNFPCPVSAENVLLSSDSYIVRQLPLKELLEPEFIAAFVKRGLFYGLSLSQDTASDCCVAVTPNGFLSIAVNRDTFESIQLTGKPIQTSRKSKDRYLCEINLKDEALVRDTAKRKIILKALASEHIPTMDLQISWTPPAARFCPSSMAQYFSNRNFTIELCPTKHKQKQVCPGTIPQMIAVDEGETKEEFEEKVVEFLEFVGLMAMDCSTKGDEDGCINSYSFSGLVEETPKVTVNKWKGLFTKHLLKRLYNYLEVYIGQFPDVPWVVLNVESTSRTPFGDAFSDQTFNIANDNSFTVILSAKQFIWHQIIPINKKF